MLSLFFCAFGWPNFAHGAYIYFLTERFLIQSTLFFLNILHYYKFSIIITATILYYITLHYITLPAFQTPPTPKVTSGASTITCYTKYSPPAQHAG